MITAGDFAFAAGSSPYRHQPRGWHLEFRRAILDGGGLVRRLDRPLHSFRVGGRSATGGAAGMVAQPGFGQSTALFELVPSDSGVALMVLCCDLPAIALTAAASARRSITI
jgi:hypothetical protein